MTTISSPTLVYSSTETNVREFTLDNDDPNVMLGEDGLPGLPPAPPTRRRSLSAATHEFVRRNSAHVIKRVQSVRSMDSSAFGGHLSLLAAKFSSIFAWRGWGGTFSHFQTDRKSRRHHHQGGESSPEEEGHLTTEEIWRKWLSEQSFGEMMGKGGRRSTKPNDEIVVAAHHDHGGDEEEEEEYKEENDFRDGFRL